MCKAAFCNPELTHGTYFLINFKPNARHVNPNGLLGDKL